MARSMLALCMCLVPASSLVILPEADVFAQSPGYPVPIAVSDEIPLRSTDDNSDQPLPVVLWHGLGDSANAEGLNEVADLISEVHEGTYVHIVSLAEGDSDRTQSWFGNVNDQLDLVCHQLATDPILSTAPYIDAIGFSQGGQFLRGYIERCGHLGPKVRNLLTFGSQHNGIAKFQKCSGYADLLCNAANALLSSSLVWSDYVQTKVVPAQYYRPATDLENYLEHSHYIADINNERPEKNATYAENLSQLEKFVMVIFEEDQTVIPKETGWFMEVDLENDKVTPLKQRDIYKEDWIGLKKLDEKGGLVFETVGGKHMQLEEKDLVRFFKQYLGPMKSPETQQDILNLEL